ncbi:MAG: alcohol dehydrogenase catalytic domain-containing protein [Roseovarius sp.]|nr:alcohol dehydrogenase catalytic domain-containing protein [Roseovarius sp.]
MKIGLHAEVKHFLRPLGFILNGDMSHGEAIVIPETGSPDVHSLKDKTVPSPAIGEFPIRNHAGALNFTDTIIRRGDMPEGMMPRLPRIPGVEGAGLVEAIGVGVDGFSVGDRVAWMGPIGAGGHGSHSLVGASRPTRIADNIDFSTAASIPVNAMTAYHMPVNLGGAAAGKSVPVRAAAGGVETMIRHIAKHLAINFIASASIGKAGPCQSPGRGSCDRLSQGRYGRAGHGDCAGPWS